MKSGLRGELAISGFMGELLLIAEDDMVNDDAGRRSGSAKMWGAISDEVAGGGKDEAGFLLKGTAVEVLSLYVMRNPRSFMRFRAFLKSVSEQNLT